MADRAFIPHPATWFNQGRYDDNPALWSRDPAALSLPNAGAPSASADREPIPEPPGWREFVASEYPLCDYAPGQPKHGIAWADIPADDAKVFADAIKRAAPRQ
jgi:hypothetical protein